MTVTGHDRIVLAGGCFWGMQDLIRKQPGIVATRVGYAGGSTEHATYSSVKAGNTGHAESIELVFDPNVTSLQAILEFFFQIHDPTTVDRQGNDLGSQYRSAIFFNSEEQKQLALETIARADASGIWPSKVVTQVEAAGPFWEAEAEHQDYLEHYPNGYTCHFLRPDWRLP